MRTGVAIQTSNYDWDNVKTNTKRHKGLRFNGWKWYEWIPA
jgi:hypothetical protein